MQTDIEKIDTINNYFDVLEKVIYNKYSIKSDEYFVFKNIELIISINEFEDSLFFDNLGYFKLLLLETKHFNQESTNRIIRFTKRKLESLGSVHNKPFYIGFNLTF